MNDGITRLETAIVVAALLIVAVVLTYTVLAAGVGWG